MTLTNAAASALLVICICLQASPVHAAAASVQQWDQFEVSLKGPSDGNPFIDVQLSAEFSDGTRKMTVSGFYDGDGEYRVRFSPPTQGHWVYITKSNVPSLAGKGGEVDAIAPTGDNHGPVRVFDTFHFAYADGTHYFEVGTTCYAWTHQTDALQEATLKTLAASPFNKLRMCIFPKSYTYNVNDPPNYPFVRGADGKFDFTRFDPENWRHLEQRIADLRRLGIEADLILFHPYDRWGFADMDKTSDDRYLRYAIARLAANRNVWWSVANEYDFMIPPLHRAMRGNKTVDDFDRFFSILQKEDPFDRQRSVHNAAKIYDNAKEWVTHASIQNRDLTQMIDWRTKFQKPIVVDECRYEGNIRESWGSLKAPEMVHQFWVGTLGGGYVGHSETLRDPSDPNDILWWSKGGTLHGESPSRIAFLRKTMEALPYWEMTPTKADANVFVLAKPGSVYLVYTTKAVPIKLTLSGDRPYTVEAIDTWNMSVDKLPQAQPGDFSLTAPRADYLLRIQATH